MRPRKPKSAARPAPRVLRVRQANERWASYVARLAARDRPAVLARRLGLPQSTITRWLDGASPTIDKLRIITENLDIPLSVLLTEAGYTAELALAQGQPPVTSGTGNDGSADDVRRAIMRDTALLDEAKQHLLNQYELLPPSESGPCAPGGRKVRRERPTGPWRRTGGARPPHTDRRRRSGGPGA